MLGLESIQGLKGSPHHVGFQESFHIRELGPPNNAKRHSMRIVQNSLDDGGVIEYDTQRSVENGIWDGIHGKRFYLAEQAPIWQGRLRGEFGYYTVTQDA